MKDFEKRLRDNKEFQGVVKKIIVDNVEREGRRIYCSGIITGLGITVAIIGVWLLMFY